MSPEAYSALFAGTGVFLTVLTIWLAQRARKESKRATELEEVQASAEEHTNEKIDRVIEKLDDMDCQIKSLASDMIEVKTTVAVHEDRFDRPRLSAVGSRRL